MFKRSYEMDTVITVYINLRKNSVPVRVHMSCTTTLHVAMKTEHVYRSRHHYMHFTALSCRYPHSTAQCRAWSGFFTTVWEGLRAKSNCQKYKSTQAYYVYWQVSEKNIYKVYPPKCWKSYFSRSSQLNSDLSDFIFV